MSLTVVLPNYNHAAYLSGAISRYLSQMGCEDQLLVIDDASTDDSIVVIGEYLRDDSRIRLIKRSNNGGVLSVLNQGLSEAETDIIYFGSANDPVGPGLFPAAVQAMSDYPEAGLFCGDGWLVRKSDGHRFPIKPALSAHPGYISPDDYRQRLSGLWKDLVLPSPSVVVRADAMRKVGGFRKEMRWHSDWFAFHVIALRHGLYYDPKPYGTFELDLESFSGRGLRSPATKRRLIRDMLTTLSQDQFQDVKDGFKYPFALGCFYNARRLIVWEGLLHPANWWILSFDLLNQAIKDITHVRFWPWIWKVVSGAPSRGWTASVKRMILKLFGANVGRKVLIDAGVGINAPWLLTLSNECHLKRGVTIEGNSQVIIGTKSVVGEGSRICSEYWDESCVPVTLLSAPVVIGSECRLLEGSLVLPGTIIGDGTIFPPYRAVNGSFEP